VATTRIITDITDISGISGISGIIIGIIIGIINFTDVFVDDGSAST